MCPTNDDPTFDNKPRMKRTTGIPKSFLKTVEKPAALLNDGTTDDTKSASGVMVNADGDYVVAEPDKASWEKFQAKTKSSAAAQKAAAAGDKELQDRGLECSIDKRIFIDPMKTPCCGTTYCNDCITNALIESDFTCPGCQSDGILIDNLESDVETSEKIKVYLDEKTAAKKEKERAEKERSKSPSVKAESTPTPEEKAKSKSPSLKSVQVKSPSKSPLPAKSTPNLDNATTVKESSAPAPKKRPADELLENPKIPKAPKAMQQQEAQKQAMLQQQQQQAMMNGMPGFPNMPFDMSQNFYGANGMNPMMNGFGMGGMMNGMNGMNPMMNPMMNFGGFPNMNMYGNGGGYGGGGNMNMMNGGGNHMNGGGMNGHQANGNGNANANRGGAGGGVGGGAAGGFSNQQKTVFAEPLPNEEDNAYFRKPVNPHRHQGRQRRARPSDYREL